MDAFSTTLLREKFVIRDPAPVSDEEPVVALSNRLVTPIPGSEEKFVVRAQNMHSCIRMAARIVAAAQEKGPILSRPRPFDWADAWQGVNEGFERKYNPNRWIAIYSAGKVVFGDGNHHPFLDIIETCDFKSRQDYEHSITMAENAFKQAGKVVRIDHDANIAMVVNITSELARCGIILRGADKTTTFNFTGKPKGGRPVRISQCLTVSAAFLEGIQLAFQVGMGKQKRRYGFLEIGSEDYKRVEAGEKRLGRLNSAIRQFDQILEVAYRPDRPDFFKMVDEAEDVARKILAPQIEAKIESGELDDEEWIV